MNSVYVGILKTGADIMSCVQCSAVAMPSIDFLWYLIQRLLIFMPYIIYSQYQYYQLRSRIYKLTWTLCYEVRKHTTFTVVQPSGNDVSQVDHGANRESDKDESSAGCGRDVCSGDMSDSCRAAKILGTPREISAWRRPLIGAFTFRHMEYNTSNMLVRNPPLWKSNFKISQYEKSHEIEWVGLKESESSRRVEGHGFCVPFSRAKKIRRVIGYSGQPDAIVLKSPTGCAAKPCTDESRRDSECELPLSKSKVGNPPSRIQFDLLIRSCLRRLTEFQSITLSRARSPKPETEADRKWRHIFERSDALLRQRINRMREMDVRKKQEKEKQWKLGVMRSRAMRAKMREEIQRLLMEEGKKKPTTVKRDEQNPTNQKVHPAEICSGYSSEQVPMFCVTQRTFRIHQSSLSKNEEGSDISNTNGDSFDVIEASDRIVNEHSDLVVIPSVFEKAEHVDMSSRNNEGKKSEEPSTKSNGLGLAENPRNWLSHSENPSHSTEVEKFAGEAVPKSESSTGSLNSEVPNAQDDVTFHQGTPLYGRSLGSHQEICKRAIEVEGRPVIRRAKRRLKERIDAPTVLNSSVDPSMKIETREENTKNAETACTKVSKPLSPNSLLSKKQAVRQRLETGRKQWPQVDEPSDRRNPKEVVAKVSKRKINRTVLGKNLNSALSKRNPRSKSSTSLGHIRSSQQKEPSKQMKNRGKQQACRLPVVSDHPQRTIQITGKAAPSKIRELFSDCIKNSPLGTHGTRRPPCAKVSLTPYMEIEEAARSSKSKEGSRLLSADISSDSIGFMTTGSELNSASVFESSPENEFSDEDAMPRDGRQSSLLLPTASSAKMEQRGQTASLLHQEDSALGVEKTQDRGE